MRKLQKRLVAHVNKFLSPFLSGYRKNYSTQHFLICLVEKWTEQLDNTYVLGSAFYGFFKGF